MNINELYAIVKRWEKGLISSDDLLSYIADSSPKLSIKNIDEIRNHEGHFSTEDELLTKLFKVAEWFFYIFNLNDLENLILSQLKEEDKLQFSQKKGRTYFSIIKCAYSLNSLIIEKFRKLYDVSLNWTFSFFRLKDPADIDAIIDKVRSDIPEMKRLFEKNSDLKNTIFFPYDFRNHVYFLIHYNDNQNATSLEEKEFSFRDLSVKTKKTFFFFFRNNEESGQNFLIIKNSPYQKYDRTIIECLNKILWLIIDYDSYPISDFSLIEKSENIPFPAKWTTSINKIYLYKPDISSLISVFWKEAYKDTQNICSGTEMSIYSIDITQEANDEATRKKIAISLSGSVNKKNITLLTDTKYIEYWLNLLRRNKLIQNKNSNYWFKTETEIIKQCFLDWEFMIKNLDDELYGISSFVESVLGIWEAKDKNISKEDIDFNKKQFRTDNIVGPKLSIVGNVKIKLNLAKYINEKIKKNAFCVQLKKENRFCWRKIDFPSARGDLKDIVIFTARNFENILSDVLKEKKSNKILFLENIDEEVIKILLENNFCGDIKSIAELFLLFSNKKDFTKWFECNKQWKNKEIKEMNVIQISESGNGGEFEDLVIELISPFLSSHMAFWKGYIWTAIPDWVFFWKKNDDDSQILVLYDCKSSKNISSYLDSGEQRKFSSYIDLFPQKNQNRNVFVIFWPKTNNDELQKISERTEFNDLLQKGHKVLYIWADVLELLNKILIYPEWNIIGAHFKKNTLPNIICDEVQVWKLKMLEIEKVKEYIMKYALSQNEMNNELYQKIDKKTGWTVDIQKEIDNFKDYLRNL